MKIELLFIFSIFISIQAWSQSSAHDYNMSHSSNDSKVNEKISSDKRRSVKMTAKMSEHQLKNMRAHLDAITAIVDAMATMNFKKMESESLRLASSPKMKMMCNNMGKATPGFTQMGLALHSTADRLVSAAKKRNYSLFVKNLAATLHTCTTCHSTFKQEIVSQESFHKSMMKGL